jgi:hypothetical protein
MQPAASKNISFVAHSEFGGRSDGVQVRDQRGHAYIGHGFVKVLHMFRTSSSLNRRWLCTLQLCDAPAIGPPPDQLMTEACTRRLARGDGGMKLRALIHALPTDIPVGLEVPTAAEFPSLLPAARLAQVVNGQVVTATRADLSEIS